MSEKMTDIVGSKFQSNSYGQCEVLEYIGKTDSNHIYRIKFLNTGNTKNDTRQSIKRKSCVDDLEQERQRQVKKQAEIDKRRQANAVKGKETIIVQKDLFRTLSLDQSTNGCAYSLFVNDQLLFYGKIDTSMCATSTEKIIKIRDTVKKMFIEHQVDIVVVEDIFCSFNVEVFKTLAILYGALQILAFECGVRFISVAATTWKSGIGLPKGKHKDYATKRKYQKAESIKKANEIYALELDDDDLADSILIGLYTIFNCIKYEAKVVMGEWS